MQMCRLPNAIMMTQPLSIVELARKLPAHIPADLRDILSQALQRYDLTAIWTDALLLNSLSENCYFCGLDLQPAELCYHLHEAHAGQHASVKTYVKQLLPHALQFVDSDCACFACGQIFNQPMDNPDDMQKAACEQLVRVHLRTQCPSIVQLSLVLTHLHHGLPRLADGEWGRGGIAGGTGLSESRTSACGIQGGQWSEAATKPRRDQAPAKKRARLSASGVTGAVSGPATEHAPDGKAPDTGGQGHAAPSSRNNISLLFQLQRKGRGTPSDVEGSRNLAPTDAIGIVHIDDASETEAVPDPLERDDKQGATPCRGDGQLSTLADSNQEWHPPSGQDNPVQAMGPAESTAEDLCKDSGESPEDVSDAHRAAGPVCRFKPGTTLSCVANTKSKPGDHVEAAAVDEGRCALPLAPSLGILSSVDHGSNKPQASQPASEQPLHDLGDQPGTEETQRPRRREEQAQTFASAEPDQEGVDLSLTRTQIITILLALVLENPNNLCFANATLFALVWTVISMNQYHLGLWGDCRSDLMHFLCSARNCPGNLSRAGFYDRILRSLGATEMSIRSGTISQQDSAEYVQLWLKTMRTPAFDMQWEKRFEASGTAHVMDANYESHTPLCLKFDAITVQCSLCNISTLARSWHQVDGMRSALLASSQCLCIHLDRCTIGPDLAVYKCDSKLQCDDTCLIPVFQDASMSVEFESYSIIALMAHLGGDGCGHYRAAIRVKQMVLGLTTPIEWVLTDDWRPPEPVWAPPSWMLQNTTMIWMVRTDLLALPSYPTMTNPDSDSFSELMQMFASDRKE